MCRSQNHHRLPWRLERLPPMGVALKKTSPLRLNRGSPLSSSCWQRRRRHQVRTLSPLLLLSLPRSIARMAVLFLPMPEQGARGPTRALPCPSGAVTRWRLGPSSKSPSWEGSLSSTPTLPRPPPLRSLRRRPNPPSQGRWRRRRRSLVVVAAAAAVLLLG